MNQQTIYNGQLVYTSSAHNAVIGSLSYVNFSTFQANLHYHYSDTLEAIVEVVITDNYSRYLLAPQKEPYVLLFSKNNELHIDTPFLYALDEQNIRRRIHDNSLTLLPRAELENITKEEQASFLPILLNGNSERLHDFTLKNSLSYAADR